MDITPFQSDISTLPSWKQAPKREKIRTALHAVLTPILHKIHKNVQPPRIFPKKYMNLNNNPNTFHAFAISKQLGYGNVGEFCKIHKSVHGLLPQLEHKKPNSVGNIDLHRYGLFIVP